MLINIYMKFHEGILNGFWVTERTQPYHKFYYFQFQRAITPKIHNPELRFLRSAHRLMLLYICVKFHEYISNSFGVIELTRFCGRQTDGQTTRAKTRCLPTLQGGRHNEPPHDKTNKVVQPEKTQISLGIRPVWSVCAVRMKKPWALSYPLSAERRLDLSLRWVHSHFVAFCHLVAQVK